MITWGINSSSHDSALAVFNEDQCVFASSAERFSKIKNSFGFDEKLINYAFNFGQPSEIIYSEKNIYKNIRKFFYGGEFKKEIEIVLPSSYKKSSFFHHHSHAAFGYYTSPFDKCLILVIDAIGEFDCLSIWKGENNKLKKIKSYWYPNSIGLFYSAMTQRVGLKPNEEEYILMALAAYGDPMKYKKEIMNTFFDYNFNLKTNMHRGCLSWNKPLRSKDYAHVAAAVQSIYEDYLKLIINTIRRINFSDNLVFTGGCALNCKANSLIYGYMNNVYIPFNPGDAGNAIGAILAKKEKKIKFKDNFLGYEIKKNIDYKKIVNELLKNKICGLAVGKAEFGPRALGHRSLLANPKEKNIIKKLNKIKEREEFRPFALSILKEDANKYFHMFNDKSQYMQYTYRYKNNDMKNICHVDMTSRIQTVDENNKELYFLLQEWKKETGLPYLINTSLNIKGQPMLNDENDIVEFEKKYKIKVF